MSLVGNVTGAHCGCQRACLPHTQTPTAEEEGEERGKRSRETFKMKSISSGKAVDRASQRFSDGNKYRR